MLACGSNAPARGDGRADSSSQVLAIGWCSIVEAQVPTPPTPSPNPSPGQASPAPASRGLSVEERLSKLEEANQELVEQNRRLTEQLKAIIRAAKPTTSGGSDSRCRRSWSRSDAGTAGLGGTDDRSPGPGANTVEGTPSTGEAGEGGDLISFAPDDPADAKGVKMGGRFGRRFTNNGLWFESPDKVFQFHVGGRTQMDASFFSAGDAVQFGPGGIGRLRDGVDPRRMRVRMEGALYENMLFTMEFDFVNSAIPLGRLGAGPETSALQHPGGGNSRAHRPLGRLPEDPLYRQHPHRQPQGADRLRAPHEQPLPELHGTLVQPGRILWPVRQRVRPRHLDIQHVCGSPRDLCPGALQQHDQPVCVPDVGGGNYRVTGRLTGLLFDEDEGRKLMHLGISGRQSGYDNGQQRFRVRGPERAGLSTVWPLYASTPIFHGSGSQQDLNLEWVNVFGPWTIDAEYNFHWSHDTSLARRPDVGTLFYSGGYVEVLYFLTGEHRAYIRESGLFDRVVPRRNAYWVEGEKGKPDECGPGAWQVGFRYNYLDLNDEGIDGGILNDFTAGLNWFINPNMKFQWNYSVTLRQSPTGLSDGTIQGFGMRYAMDY